MSDNTQNQPAKSLAQIMQESAGLGEVLPSPGHEKVEQQAAQEQQQESVPQTAPLTLEQLEKTEEFKSLSPKIKEQIRREGVLKDPAMDELDSAIQQNNEELISELQEKIIESSGKEISKEELQEKIMKNKPIDDEEDDLEAEIRKQLAEITGEEEEEDDEDLSDQLRDIEREIMNALPAYFENPHTPEDKITAALDFKIKMHTDYENNIKTVLEENDIKFKKSKKNSYKKALIKSFVQRHPHVTTPLVNSGIHVTLSGASIPQIIQMNNIRGSSNSEVELKKLVMLHKHLVDTSVGSKISHTQFAKMIHYKDLQTLYFNLYAGTFPDVTDFPAVCENNRCNADIKLKIHTADLVLNADEFKDTSEYILYDAQTVEDVIEKSSVSKEKQVILKNKTIVGLKSPSVYDIILVSRRVELLRDRMKNIDMYSNVLGYLTFVTFIALPDSDGEYVKYDDYEDILEILNAFDDDAMLQIDDHVEEYTTENTVRYGFKEFKCPKCGRLHKERELDMSDLLFTLSQYQATLKGTEKLKKREEKKKKEE